MLPRRMFLLLAAVILAGAVAAPALATALATPSDPPPAPAPPSLLLPAPTGPAATGTTRIALTDASRHDQLVPGPRELVTQLWYPTAATDGPLAPYAPPAEAEALSAFYPATPGVFAATVTHSRSDAPALAGAHPLVLLTHGLCGAAVDLTALAEDLASRGFVVAATGSTGESPAVQFPDGHVVPLAVTADCATAGDPASPEGIAAITRLQAVRVADQRFVLDTLSRRAGLPLGLEAAIDPSRVAGVGHSFGGSTMMAVAADDPRVAAAVDLDGFIVGSGRRLAKPVLVLGSGYHDPVGDPTWGQAFPGLTGWHRWVRITGAGHYRFTDLGPSAEPLGLRASMPARTWEQVFGDVDGVRTHRTVADYTGAFLDRFLRGAPAPELDVVVPGAEFPTT